MKDFQEITEHDGTYTEPGSERSTEQTVNVQCMDGFTPKEAAHAVGVSERTVFKYADTLIPLWGEEKIREDGLYTEFAIAQMGRIKEMKPARYAKEVRRELGLHEEVPVEILPPEEESALTVVNFESSLTLDGDLEFEEYYAQLSQRYQDLEEQEAAIAKELATTEAELLEAYEEQEISRQQEMAVELREAKMRGADRAMREIQTEEAAYKATLDRHRREKAKKEQRFRQPRQSD